MVSFGESKAPTGVALLCAALALAGCSSKKKDVISFADAAPPVPTVSTPIVVVPPVGPTPSARAELDRAKGWLADLKFLLSNKITTSPQLISGEGDAASICDAVAVARPKATGADLVATLDEAGALCAFDVPLLVANEALDHLKTSTSQASVRLMCTVSAKEIAKARAVKPKDPKVLQADRRRSASGRCH